jgi:thiosulfate/3-mercaptopyruvate sulfurtransferase
MDTLVTTGWLSRHLEDPDLVLLDCSVCTGQEEDGGFHNISGRGDYDRGHIPGARFADLKGEPGSADSRVEFAVPTPEQFCAAMGVPGVGDASRVVLDDAGYSAWASSTAFAMTGLGFTDVAVYTASLQEWAADPANPLVVESP